MSRAVRTGLSGSEASPAGDCWNFAANMTSGVPFSTVSKIWIRSLEMPMFAVPDATICTDSGAFGPPEIISSSTPSSV
jgi:hypothetical protein